MTLAADRASSSSCALDTNNGSLCSVDDVFIRSSSYTGRNIASPHVPRWKDIARGGRQRASREP